MPNGSTELSLLAARLKVAAARDLRLQMVRGLRAAAAPVIQDLRVTAVNVLPKSGGLNELVAHEKIKTQVRTSPRTAGVRVVTLDELRNATNSGWVRHPVFGNRNVWATTSTPRAAGWWDNTVAKGGPRAVVEMEAVLREVGTLIMGHPA